MHRPTLVKFSPPQCWNRSDASVKVTFWNCFYAIGGHAHSPVPFVCCKRAVSLSHNNGRLNRLITLNNGGWARLSSEIGYVTSTSAQRHVVFASPSCSSLAACWRHRAGPSPATRWHAQRSTLKQDIVPIAAKRYASRPFHYFKVRIHNATGCTTRCKVKRRDSGRATILKQGGVRDTQVY